MYGSRVRFTGQTREAELGAPAALLRVVPQLDGLAVAEGGVQQHGRADHPIPVAAVVFRILAVQQPVAERTGELTGRQIHVVAVRHEERHAVIRREGVVQLQGPQRIVVSAAAHQRVVGSETAAASSGRE